MRATARQPSFLRASLDPRFSPAGADGVLPGAGPAFPFCSSYQQIDRVSLSRHVVNALVAKLMIGLCSCASTRRSMRRSSFRPGRPTGGVRQVRDLPGAGFQIVLELEMRRVARRGQGAVKRNGWTFWRPTDFGKWFERPPLACRHRPGLLYRSTRIGLNVRPGRRTKRPDGFWVRTSAPPACVKPRDFRQTGLSQDSEFKPGYGEHLLVGIAPFVGIARVFASSAVVQLSSATRLKSRGSQRR